MKTQINKTCITEEKNCTSIYSDKQLNWVYMYSWTHKWIFRLCESDISEKQACTCRKAGVQAKIFINLSSAVDA